MESRSPRKPLHRFVLFLFVAAVVIFALDVAMAVIAGRLTATLPLAADAASRSTVSAEMIVQILRQALTTPAYLAALAVIIELVDRILWRLTPEAERRVVWRSPKAVGSLR